MDGKAQRLTRRTDFRRLQKDGRVWAGRLLVLRAYPNLSPANRVAFSVSKAVGKAVARNRLKRQLRDILRKIRLKQGWDLLVIARPAAARSTFQELQAALAQLLGQAGLLER